MPLQAEGLAVGGDVQTRATDVVTTRITRKQAEKIAALCNNSVEIVPQDQCSPALIELLRGRAAAERLLPPCQLDQFGFCLAVRMVAGSDAWKLGVIGYAEVTGLSCSAEQTVACLRVGLRTGEVLDQVAQAPRVAVATASATLTTPPSTTPASSARSSTPPAPAPPGRTAAPVGTASAQPPRAPPATSPARSP